MILTSKECQKCVQQHRITFDIQYYDIGTRIAASMAESCKKCVKKEQNVEFSDLFGGGVVQTVYILRHSLCQAQLQMEIKDDLKEAFFFRREKTTLDQIGWGPLYALYDHENMCVRKLIT